MIVLLTHKINPKSFLSNFWGSLQIDLILFYHQGVYDYSNEPLFAALIIASLA